MRVKSGTEGKTKDVTIENVTPENYIVPDNEKHLYHTVIEVKKFDSETGKRLSIPRVQKFGKKMYENAIADNLKKQGYTIIVLHDPNAWLAEQAEVNKAKAAERAEAQAKAKQVAEAKAAEENEKAIAAAVAKALAEQAEANQKTIDKLLAEAVAKVNKSAKIEGGK